MGTTLQSMQRVRLENKWITKEGVNLFGIRHLSASGAFFVEEYLDEINPDIVLIEGPSDATDYINDITKKGIKPPIAMLFYTTETPVHSLIYPYATYSPEYQGIIWANNNNKKCRFIDLPSSIKSPLYRTKEIKDVEMNIKKEEAEGEKEKSSLEDDLLEKRINYYNFNNNLYEEIARLGGEEDYDIYWERHFEHIIDLNTYLNTVGLHSSEIRTITEGMEREADPSASSINTLREAYMKRSIVQAINEGIKPGKIVVITGAYHLKGLMDNNPLMDDELSILDRTETKITLMPYSYYKLSSFSGYGAGNHAPYYYEMMYKAMKENKLKLLPALYLSKLSELTRKKHGYSSTATVIEAVKLAESLQYIHNGILPTLKDLHDASVATMAGGESSVVTESLATIDIGTRIGELPDGVSQTPIQDDLNRHLKKLKLERYKTVVANDLKLDLRENIRVKSKDSAFLDLNRSTFFHRLELLGVGFAKIGRSNQQLASWAESWVLCWTPEVEIQIVESVLYGDTIEAAASYVIKDKIENSKDVVEIASLVRKVCECKLFDLMHNALKRLQEIASDSESFLEVVNAAREMSFIIQYGNLRMFDSSVIIPILQQLFLKASLILIPSTSCNNEFARKIAECMATMHNISQEHYDIVNDNLWITQLKDLYKAHDKNPILCGFSLSILIERGEVDDESINEEICLNLSLGSSPEGGASWLEGLTMRNRYVLLSKTTLWEQLDSYVKSLDDDEFKRILVCLRRVFSSFELHEKNGVCDILSETWGVNTLFIQEFLQEDLGEAENNLLNDLNDFDFGDLL